MFSIMKNCCRKIVLEGGRYKFFRIVYTQVFQLIWIQGVQEFVLCVLGDMCGAFLVAFGGCLCLNQVDGAEDQRGANIKSS